MGVTQGVDRNAAAKIEVALAVSVPDFNPLAALQHERTGVGGNDVAFKRTHGCLCGRFDNDRVGRGGGEGIAHRGWEVLCSKY